MVSGRFRFTSAGNVFEPSRIFLVRDEATLSEGSMRAPRRSPKRLLFRSRAVSRAADSASVRRGVFSTFLDSMNAVYGSGGIVMIDDLVLNRFCFAYLTAAPRIPNGLLMSVELTFAVPDGVWRKRSASEPAVFAAEIQGDGSVPHLTVENGSAARGFQILTLGASSGTVGSLTDGLEITRLCRNLLYDSGFTAYSRSSSASASVVGKWVGYDRVAPYMSLAPPPSPDGRDTGYGIMIYSTGESTHRVRQKVPCFAGRTYRFSVQIRRPSGESASMLPGSEGSCRLRLRYFDSSGTTLTTTFSTITMASDDWQRVEVEATAPSNTRTVEAMIGVSGAGGGVYVCQPMLVEGGASGLAYLNTSDDEYAPQTLTFKGQLPTDSDVMGALYIDTERRIGQGRRYSYREGNSTVNVSRDNWGGLTGLISGRWLELLPGTNHLRFTLPSSSSAVWPVKAIVGSRSVI